jgi:hypothetical protein
MEVHLQSFSTSVLNKHKWLTSSSGRFISGIISPGMYWNIIRVGPWSGLDIVEIEPQFSGSSDSNIGELPGFNVL